MASSWLIMIASLAFSYSSPVDKMNEVRPIKSLFHPAIFVSIIGQAAIHLGCMIYAVSLATKTMGPALLKEVVNFHKRGDREEDRLQRELEQGVNPLHLLFRVSSNHCITK